jgi:hypothetical protein
VDDVDEEGVCLVEPDLFVVGLVEGPCRVESGDAGEVRDLGPGVSADVCPEAESDEVEEGGGRAEEVEVLEEEGELLPDETRVDGCADVVRQQRPLRPIHADDVGVDLRQKG